MGFTWYDTHETDELLPFQSGTSESNTHTHKNKRPQSWSSSRTPGIRSAFKDLQWFFFGCKIATSNQRDLRRSSIPETWMTSPQPSWKNSVVNMWTWWEVWNCKGTSQMASLLQKRNEALAKRGLSSQEFADLIPAWKHIKGTKNRDIASLLTSIDQECHHVAGWKAGNRIVGFKCSVIYGIERLFESSPIVELGLKYAVIMPRWTFCRVDAFWAHFGILPNFECCEVAIKKLSFAYFCWGSSWDVFWKSTLPKYCQNQYFLLLSLDEPRSPKTRGTKSDKPKSPGTAQTAPLSLTALLPFLDCSFTVPFSSWLFLYSSFLFLTVPLRILSLLDCSFSVPFFSWLFLSAL